MLERHRAFAVNVLGPQHVSVAERFSGRGGIKGAERYQDATWLTLVTGTPVLGDAISVLDCEVEEIIERHTSAIVIGRVVAVKIEEEATTPVSLTYWRGRFGALALGDAWILHIRPNLGCFALLLISAPFRNSVIFPHALSGPGGDTKHRPVLPTIGRCFCFLGLMKKSHFHSGSSYWPGQRLR